MIEEFETLTDDETFTQSQACRYLSKQLEDKNLSEYFENDIGLLLAENRRARRSNIAKYGNIPFRKDRRNRIHYEERDLKELSERILQIAASNKKRELYRRIFRTGGSA